MNKGLVNINWNDIDNLSHEDISYFLFLEGKTTECISKIRNISEAEVQKHLVLGKIKYRYIERSKNIEELFTTISKVNKEEKLAVLNSLEASRKKMLSDYIRGNYGDMLPKEKESAVWIIGELKDENDIDILYKASVNKHVNIRRMAVSAMGKLGKTEMEPILIRILDDINPQVVLYAIKALKKINSLKAKDKIKEIYISTDREYLKNAAKEYLFEETSECEGKDI